MKVDLLKSGMFEEVIRFCDISKILEKLNIKDKIENFTIDLLKTYPLFKDLFGVQIEFGTIRFIKISVDDAIEVLDALTTIKTGSHHGYEIDPVNNISGVMNVANKYNLETPDEGSVSGYITNNELVRVIRDDYDAVSIKYKDKPENIYYNYKFFFTKVNGILYLVIEKSI